MQYYLQYFGLFHFEFPYRLVFYPIIDHLTMRLVFCKRLDWVFCVWLFCWQELYSYFESLETLPLGDNMSRMSSPRILTKTNRKFFHAEVSYVHKNHYFQEPRLPFTIPKNQIDLNIQRTNNVSSNLHHIIDSPSIWSWWIK